MPDHAAAPPEAPQDVGANRYLSSRWTGPFITSYAQNAEDIRLWRIFSSTHAGFYVDVGAGDPVVDSVTKLFYDAGWSGINIEPGPNHRALATARPRDLTLKVAVASRRGEAEMWMTSPDPGLSSFRRPDQTALPDGFTATRRTVQTCRLDDVLATHAPDRSLDFLKIDVEGMERDVLESFDLRSIRPTVVLIEAISPSRHAATHEEWEEILLDRGYAFAAFDGINRFYVPVERQELIAALAYPISVLDRYESRATAVLRANLTNVLREHDQATDTDVARDASRAEIAARDAQALVREMQATMSWRVTRPLRFVRRVRVAASARRASSTADADERALELERACVERLSQVRALLDDDRSHRRPPSPSTLDEALVGFENAARSSQRPARTTAWLALLAVDGSYPNEDEVESAASLLRRLGAEALTSHVRERLARSLELLSGNTSRLEVVREVVVVDASHTVSTDHHTGIQRVVRETLARWVELSNARLAAWDDRCGGLQLLSKSESERVRGWRDLVNVSGAPVGTREPERASRNLLVPLDCQLILPELSNPARSRALRALVKAGVLRRFSVIGYDLVPFIAAETTATGMVETFAEYLALIKHSDRLSAISAGTAECFDAFKRMLVLGGVEGPRVVAQPLPTERLPVSAHETHTAQQSLQLTGLPVVLVVGSHEPRKNHLAVLEAAEKLWEDGLTFELVMIGGGEWRSDEVRRNADRLRDAERPLNLRVRATDTELWVAYNIARFTVFPSLLEGFGLPVAESLAAGTPVITSSYGTMAEIAAAGGALTVDPRSVDDIEAKMRLLLTDDELLERLRREARARDLGSWDDYAREVWQFLTEDSRVAA